MDDKKPNDEGARADVDLLDEYLDRIRRGDAADKQDFLRRCPANHREELELAIEGADALEAIARELRPDSSPAAHERALKALHRRLTGE